MQLPSRDVKAKQHSFSFYDIVKFSLSLSISQDLLLCLKPNADQGKSFVRRVRIDFNQFRRFGGVREQTNKFTDAQSIYAL